MMTGKIKKALLYCCMVLSVPLASTSFSSCRTVPITGRKQLVLASESAIVNESSLQYQQFVKEMPHCTDAAKVERVNRVCRRIADAADAYLREHNMDDNLMNWQFTLIADRRVNAFCMPGGKIVIFTGILPLCQTDAELATVISHEVSHAIARHSNERISQEMLRRMGGMALSLSLPKMRYSTRRAIIDLYGLGSTLLVSLPYSRSHEYEADEMGLVFMAMAGYDPRAAVSFWKKMSEQGGKNPPEFLSTHPSDVNRIANIEKFMPTALKYYHPSTQNKASKSK